MNTTRRWPTTLPFVGCLALLAMRLVLAYGAPLGNDEAYYWDWSRALQLSFLDHPPGVAWTAWLGGHLASGPLGARCLVPFYHLGGSALLLGVLRLLKGPTPWRESELWSWFILTQLVPAFSLEGLMLLPDSGLLLALPLALYGAVSAAKAPTELKTQLWSLAAGVGLGVAGVFKYHAAPLALGLAAGVLLTKPKGRRLYTAVTALLPAVLIAVAITAPVWIWNERHNWASFRFQGDHGFGGLGLSFVPALRAYFGQALILTPLVFICVPRLLLRVSLTKDCWRRLPRLWLVPMAGFLPLFLLLESLAWFKQLLPHWLAPAYWLMVPSLALAFADDRPWATMPKRWWANFGFAAFVVLVLPWVLALAPLRHTLVDAFAGKPGGLSELTLWEPLAQTLTADPDFQGFGMTPAPLAPATCPKPYALASLRWFWTAQLAANLPGEPHVYSLDFNHPSYYSFRDRLGELAGCPVLVVADARHVDDQQLGQVIDIERRRNLVVATHRDTEIVMIMGRLKNPAVLSRLDL